MRNGLPSLYSDPKMKIAFPEKSIKAIYKTRKNLKESYPPIISINKKSVCCSISNCNKRCDICTNFMIFDNSFKCVTAGKYYEVRLTLSCNSADVITLTLFHPILNTPTISSETAIDLKFGVVLVHDKRAKF